jgi:hypothetical protein
LKGVKVVNPREEAMTKTQLQKKIAHLEFVHDQLETELMYVDDLLKSVGFPRGLASAKEVAIELLEEAEKENQAGNENI